MIILNESFRSVNAKGGRVGGKHPLYPDAGRLVKSDDFSTNFNLASSLLDPIVGFGVIRNVVNDFGDEQSGGWEDLSYDWESGINKWEVKRFNVTIEVKSETQFVRQPNILFDIEINAQGYRECLRTGSSFAELLSSNVDLISALENWNTTSENWESLNQLIIWSDAMYPPRTITDTTASLITMSSSSPWFKTKLLKRTSNLLLELQSSSSYQLSVFGDWATTANQWENAYPVWPTFPPQTITDSASATMSVSGFSSFYIDTIISRSANLSISIDSANNSFNILSFGDWATTGNKWENLFTVWPTFPPQTITDTASASTSISASSSFYIDTIISRSASTSISVNASSSFNIDTIISRSASASISVNSSNVSYNIYGNWVTTSTNWENTSDLWAAAGTGQTITDTASSLISISSNSSFLVDKLIKRTANVAFDIITTSSGSTSTVLWETTSTQWQAQSLLWESASTGYTITDTASASIILTSSNVQKSFIYGWNTDPQLWENQSYEWPIIWSPANSTSIEGWWDASDTNTVTTSGSEVTSVTDKSGNGYTLAPLGTNTTGPSYGTRTQNGLNVFEFTETNLNVLENNSFAWNQASNALGFAAIYRLDDDGVDDQDFLLSGTESSSRIGIRRLTSGAWQILCSGGSLSTSSTTVGVEPVTQIMVARFNASTSRIRINGTLEASGTIGNVSFSSLNINGNYLEQQGLAGFIGEIVFFSDLTETSKIEGYLAHKWGLAGDLPSNHPYKVFAP